MPAVGSIIRKGVNVQFLCARSDSGSPLETPREVFEELTTAGCDGRRYRTIHTQFPSFSLSTITEATTYSDAVRIRNQMEAMNNKLVGLYLSLSGQNFNWNNVHVDGVNARAIAGQVIAAGSSASTAHVICDWQLTITDFEQVAKT